MIKIKNLIFGYRPNQLLFENINTNFEKGKIYGLLGKNGAGKTTLLKLCAGLLFPHQGQITLNNFQAQKREPDFLNKIFFLTEEYSLPKMKISTFTKINSQFYPNFDKEKLSDYLEQFEIDQNKTLTQMSYGQKKKFLISFALSTNVPLIIFDEPTNGMDIPSKTLFRKIVAQSMTDDNTIIISTHQVRDIEGLIDHVKIIEKGQIIFDSDFNLVQEKITAIKSENIPENAIYSTEILGAYLSLIPSNGEIKNNVDLELLFNSVMQNPVKIQQILKN
jgi:ABC-2 type transport system ATP-binding protein